MKICITAGVGSDHIDLNAAVDRKIQVLEVSGSNVVSVAEHVVMSILLLVRNFVPAHEVSLSFHIFNFRPARPDAGYVCACLVTDADDPMIVPAD